MIYVTVYMSNVYLILIHNTMICIDNFYLEYKPNKTGVLKRRQTYFTTHKMIQMSDVYIINGLPMHQIFILKLFELHRVQISVQDFVLIDIYFFVLLLWVFEFGRIFELHKMHWIKQNWLTIIQGKSKRCIIISHQAFWNVKLLFEGKFWYGYTYFFDIKH